MILGMILKGIVSHLRTLAYFHNAYSDTSTFPLIVSACCFKNSGWRGMAHQIHNPTIAEFLWTSCFDFTATRQKYEAIPLKTLTQAILSCCGTSIAKSFLEDVFVDNFYLGGFSRQRRHAVCSLVLVEIVFAEVPKNKQTNIQWNNAVGKTLLGFLSLLLCWCFPVGYCGSTTQLPEMRGVLTGDIFKTK